MTKINTKIANTAKKYAEALFEVTENSNTTNSVICVLL